METSVGCPGAAGFKGPQELRIVICPECGREIEIFTRDVQVMCECGFIAYNDLQSCLKWCAHARKCLGEEAYERWLLKDSSLRSE